MLEKNVVCRFHIQKSHQVCELQTLERELYSLEAATAELERRFAILQEAIPQLEKLYQDAWTHALRLQQTARHLEE